jgi:uncharacterized membrane protein
MTESAPGTKPTPEIEAKGLKAYEQARAYERLKTWRLPVTYVAFVLVPVITGVWVWAIGYHLLGWLNFGMAILLSWMGRFQWKQLRARHANNRRLLAQLEAEYGDQLSWVQVERHFTQLEKLKREVFPDPKP